MLDQLFNIVKQFGQETVVNNPEVPNEYNQEVMADATSTIASGFQNVMAGGGFQNILDLFKDGGGAEGDGEGGGLGHEDGLGGGGGVDREGGGVAGGRWWCGPW